MIQHFIERPPKLGELVAKRIQDLIIAGAWKPGSRLPAERELAEQFGVSRPVVREVIKVLLARGVLKDVHGRGTYVLTNVTGPLTDLFDLFLTQDTPNAAANLFEVRKLLEVEIAGLAAERASEEDIRNLERLNQRIKQAHKNSEAEWPEDLMRRYNSLDFDFHLSLAKCTKNSLFVILMTALSGAFKSNWEHMHQRADVRGHGIQMHEKILKAIRSRDARQARRATRENLEAFLAHARES
jgi:GntR family transcriptional repressor for pyruvate dehydrogenase complex